MKPKTIIGTVMFMILIVSFVAIVYSETQQSTPQTYIKIPQGKKIKSISFKVSTIGSEFEDENTGDVEEIKAESVNWEEATLLTAIANGNFICPSCKLCTLCDNLKFDLICTCWDYHEDIKCICYENKDMNAKGYRVFLKQNKDWLKEKYKDICFHYLASEDEFQQNSNYFPLNSQEAGGQVCTLCESMESLSGFLDYLIGDNEYFLTDKTIYKSQQ